MIRKYPRTHHIEGSRLQPGDEDMRQVKWSDIQQQFPHARVIVEEKMDGANAGISSSQGKLLLQSRGHYLTGGKREKHFDLFKQWASQFEPELCAVLGEQYILYGEWLYAKHTVFYDALPQYFLEFDILDTKKNLFLSTHRRRALLKTYLPMIESVGVLYEGAYPSLSTLTDMVQESLYISPQHIERLSIDVEERGLSVDTVMRETDASNIMEGIYIKIEDEHNVLARYKYIRYNFLLTVIESETHWLNRPIIPNQLRS